MIKEILNNKIEEEKEDNQFVVNIISNNYYRNMSRRDSFNRLSSIQEAPSWDEFSQYGKLLKFKSRSRFSSSISNNIAK